MTISGVNLTMLSNSRQNVSLMIFNEVAYLTFKSIFHKPLNIV